MAVGISVLMKQNIIKSITYNMEELEMRFREDNFNENAMWSFETH